MRAFLGNSHMGGWTSRFNAMTLTSRAAYGSTAVECPLAVGGRSWHFSEEICQAAEVRGLGVKRVESNVLRLSGTFSAAIFSSPSCPYRHALPLLAQNRHFQGLPRCPLPGAKRTRRRQVVASGSDPQQTYCRRGWDLVATRVDRRHCSAITEAREPAQQPFTYR
jgi:hypothetical protein